MPKNKNIVTTRENIITWLENDEIEDHRKRTLKFIRDNDLNILTHKGNNIIFWSAHRRYKKILEAALQKPEAAPLINQPNDDQIKNRGLHTPLSISIFFGYSDIVDLLLDSTLEIHLGMAPEENPYNPFLMLGKGLLAWPTDVENYYKIFNKLIAKINKKRAFFVTKYRTTNESAYLACLHLYDQLKSGEKDSNGHLYRDRPILAVEDVAIRRFFRANKDMREGGVAKVLQPILFAAGANTPLDGYAARSLIIAITDKMIRTDQQSVKDAAPLPIDDPNKIILKLEFTLGSTQFQFKWLPMKWQRGNCTLKINGHPLESFGHSLADKLQELTSTNTGELNKRTQQLGRLFLNKTKELQPFRHHEFTYHAGTLRVRIPQDSQDEHHVATPQEAQKTIHRLNGLLILWSIIEPLRRLSKHLPGNPAAQVHKSAYNLDHIPVATMQIRALQLLAAGHIAICDIFGRSTKYAEDPYQDVDHNAEYGVSTGKNLPQRYDVVKEKAEQLAKIGPHHPCIASYPSWFSRNATKTMLKEGYGVADESSDSDYSDDEFKSEFKL